MTAEQAPFYADVAEAPAGVSAHWLTCADDVRIRAACLAKDARGTVFLRPGRSEDV